MPRLFLIRHTKVADSEICYGQSDVPLAETSEQEFETLFQLITDLKIQPDSIITSPAKRCLDLAKFVGGNLEKRLEPKIDARLIEINFGQWENKPWTDVPREELDLWASNLLEYTFPEGENVNQLFERADDFLTEQKKEAAGDVLLFSHAGVIRCLLTLLDNRPKDKLLNYKVDYGSVQMRNLKVYKDC